MQLFVGGKIHKIKESFYKNAQGQEVKNYDVVMIHPECDETVTVSVNEKYIDDFKKAYADKQEIEKLPVYVNVYNTKQGSILRITYRE